MFALVDCNNFYASCEQVFNPKLEKKPLAVLSNNDGIVIARNAKAKQIGVKMGQPIFELKEQVAKGEILTLSSNFTLYADMSERVMQTLSSFSPEMEIYSIDEAFFRLQEARDWLAIAAAMRKKVKQWTGIPISIGIAPTKTLAKIANEAAKKEKRYDGVYIMVSPQEIESRLAITELEDIWGIGKNLALRLRKEAIHSALQLARADEKKIQKLLGIGGLKTALELKGTPCFAIDEIPEKKKSIVCSRSFSQKIQERSMIEEAIASFAVRAAEKLREQQSCASFLSVFIQTSPFQEPYVSRSCHVQIPNPTAYTPDLISLAKEGLSQIFQEGVGYKKAGVLLGDFTDEGVEPLDFLTPNPASPKKAKAMQALDKINARYDKEAIRFAAEGVEDKGWIGARAHISPKFTTSWHELLKVK